MQRTVAGAPSSAHREMSFHASKHALARHARRPAHHPPEFR